MFITLQGSTIAGCFYNMEMEIVELRKGAVIGFKINLDNAPVLLIRADKGYAVCGYFNPETIEKLGVVFEKNEMKDELCKLYAYASEKYDSLYEKNNEQRYSDLSKHYMLKWVEASKHIEGTKSLGIGDLDIDKESMNK